jgi:hypothetical protein
MDRKDYRKSGRKKRVVRRGKENNLDCKTEVEVEEENLAYIE